MEGSLLTKSEHTVDITLIDGNYPPLLDYQPPDEDVERSSHPYEMEFFWNPIEFVFTLVQIVAAIVVLIQPRDEEHPQTILFIWIIGYTCGCIATLPILCWRFFYYNQSFSPGYTEEYTRRTRVNEVMDTLKLVLEGFFVVWFVVFLWNFMTNASSLDDTTTQFFWLVVALLSFSCIRYVLVNLTCAVICYLLPGLLCYFAAEEFMKLILRLIGGFLSCICR